MQPTQLEVADIFREYGELYCRHYSLSPEQAKVFNLIQVCRTSALGGHKQQCTHCGYEQPAYNSCRNRHCPKCQSSAKQKWLNARSAEVLPCGYFHLVFTLPHKYNPLILVNKQLLLSLLFKQVNEVLQSFAKDPQWRLVGKIGFLTVLHTWSQTLMDHFHVHCLVPAGVLSADETRWIMARKKYLFNAKSLAKALRHRYSSALIELYKSEQLQFPGKTKYLAEPGAFYQMVSEAKRQKWVVYAKRPFAGPEQVLEYLGRYTHRVAISNYRIVDVSKGQVTFTYKDRSNEGRIKPMTLSCVEFIRRFLLHVLPDGFVKIRYYGFMAHRNRNRAIALVRELIQPDTEVQIRQESVAEMMLRVAGIDIASCPNCGKGELKPVGILAKAPIARAREPTR